MRVAAARYEPVRATDATWRRLPLHFTTDVDVSTRSTGEELELEPGLGLYVRVREPDDDGVAAVTLVLDQPPRGAAVREGRALVLPDEHRGRRRRQARSSASAAPTTLPVNDEDLESYRLIYRDVRSFAVGHGTSVEWDVDDDDRRRATAVADVDRPDVRAAARRQQSGHRHGSASACGCSPATTATRPWRRCAQLADDYEPGSTRATASVDDLDRRTCRPPPTKHLEDCRTALERMHAASISSRPRTTSGAAFQLANLAMLRQRARAAWIADGRPSGGPVEDDSHRWRPFQIAFILLNLDGIADPRHEDRELLDLLWFPTGGGKTEAYLGLIAFTILLRRLRRRTTGRGVTVLMRYTLRLLTIQQFERAAALICALEAIRARARRTSATRRSRSGCGSAGTGHPATVAGRAGRARQAPRRPGRREGQPGAGPQRAPGAGRSSTTGPTGSRKSNPRLVISCRNKDCEFATGLPIHVVDEDIYREQPALIIATADKFATLPWVKGAHSLFGVDEPTCRPRS